MSWKGNLDETLEGRVRNQPSMVIVDTTVWFDYQGGITNFQTSWLDRELDRQRLGLIDIILCEVLQGERTDAVFYRVRRELLKFAVFQTGGIDLAVTAAFTYRSLRKHGYTGRKTIDCLIASFCLLQGRWLRHQDHDFDPFEKHLGLRVVLAQGSFEHR